MMYLVDGKNSATVNNGKRVHDRLVYFAQNSNMPLENVLEAVAVFFNHADWNQAQLFIEHMDKQYRQYDDQTK